MAFKFNNGAGALLCDGCGKMIASGLKVPANSADPAADEFPNIPPLHIHHKGWIRIGNRYFCATKCQQRAKENSKRSHVG